MSKELRTMKEWKIVTGTRIGHVGEEDYTGECVLSYTAINSRYPKHCFHITISQQSKDFLADQIDPDLFKKLFASE